MTGDPLSTTSPVAAASAGRPATYGRIAARGMLWMSLTAVISKSMGFVTNLVLGWLLTKEDFGLFAIAGSLSSLVFVLADGGTARLVRHPDDYRRLGRAVSTLSLAFNVSAALLLGLLAFPAGRAYAEPALPWLMLVLAASLPLGNRPLVLRTRLGSELQFRALSRIGAISAFVRNASMIAFALSGFGPLSFVLPLLVVNLVEWIILSRIAPGRIPGAPLNRESLREIVGATRWIILGMLAAALVNNGAPVAIRAFRDTDVVGTFAFGLAIAVAPYVLFTAGLRSVLLPSMARLREEPARQASALHRAVRTLALVGAPIAVGSALVAPPLTHFLWQGRWDAAIPAIAILGLPLAFRVSGPIGGSLLEARGEWRLRAAMLWIDGLTTVGAAALGAWLGGVLSIAICFSAQRVLMGLTHCAVAGARVDLPLHRLLAALVPAHLVAGFAGGVVLTAVGSAGSSSWHPLLDVLFRGSLFAVLAVCGSWICFGRHLREAYDLVMGRRARKAAPADEAHEPPVPDER